MKPIDVTNCEVPIRCLPEDTVCSKFSQEQYFLCSQEGKVIGRETYDDGLVYTGEFIPIIFSFGVIVLITLLFTKK